ncbi:MAG: iron-siderophore ABC transporter substrate-binding protein, partial [Thermomicrobiales bacterium]
MSIVDSKLNRRHLVAGIGASAIALGIGGNRVMAQATPQSSPVAGLSLDPSTPEEMGAPGVPEATVSTASDASPVGPLFASYADFGTDAEPGVFPRDVRHAFGTTVLETQPERLITLDSGELDAAVSMGLVPVGAVEYTRDSMATYSRERVGDIPLVGTLDEPDIEAILGLSPDLMISSKLRHDQAIYDQLVQIGPAVFSLAPGVTFKLNFKLYAQALGRKAEGAAFIKKYEDGVRALNALLPNPRPTTSIVNVRAAELRFYQRSNFLGMILTDLGFPRNEPENVDDFAFFGSQENLGEYAAGEFLIVAVADAAVGDVADQVLASDVWQTLPAVQSGNLLMADTNTFIGGVG